MLKLSLKKVDFRSSVRDFPEMLNFSNGVVHLITMDTLKNFKFLVV